jgi:hypothetical protein
VKRSRGGTSLVYISKQTISGLIEARRAAQLRPLSSCVIVRTCPGALSAPFELSVALRFHHWAREDE